MSHTLASFIDHTLLKPDATKEQIVQLCAEAKEHQFVSVCISQFSADPAVQIAHTQTIYNVVCSLLVLPVCAGFARLVEWMVPERA